MSEMYVCKFKSDEDSYKKMKSQLHKQFLNISFVSFIFVIKGFAPGLLAIGQGIHFK